MMPREQTTNPILQALLESLFGSDEPAPSPVFKADDLTRSPSQPSQMQGEVPSKSSSDQLS
jgi:hypothetical protein